MTKVIAIIIATMTALPATGATTAPIGSVGLVSSVVFADREDFNRGDVVAWEIHGLLRADCLAQARQLQKQGRPAVCFMD